MFYLQLANLLQNYWVMTHSRVISFCKATGVLSLEEIEITESRSQKAYFCTCCKIIGLWHFTVSVKPQVCCPWKRWKSQNQDFRKVFTVFNCRPRWLSWMRCLTGDQEVAGSTPIVGNILSWRLIMKYFLRSFSSFRWFKKGSCQFLAKEYAQYWLTA